MENIRYRKLSIDECSCIKDLDPSQYIGKAWREVNGVRQLVEINYQETDFPNGYLHHYNNLRETIISGGCAIGCFDSYNKLLGFVTINNKLFGDKYNYVLLDQLFISLSHRKIGIGRKLFNLATTVALSMNADRIYICAGSAEETIKFYLAIGCRQAEEINKDLYESDPRDFQLEYILKI